MKYLFSLIFFILFFSKNLAAQMLDRYQWQNRIIIIQSDNTSSKKMEAQTKLLLHYPQQLDDRKLILFHSNSSKLQQIFPKKGSHADDHSNIQFKEPYEIVLIGLDGGVKMRTSDIKEPQEIFDYIDSMPMRSSEIRNKQKN